MSKKNTLLIAALFLSSNNTCASFTLDDSPYRKEACTWAHSYLCDEQNKLLVSQEDLMLIANLCYLSFMRSYCTLKAQDISLQAVSSIWKGWQNIAQTRLNPSHKTPYEISTQNKELTGEVFWKAHDEHRTMGAAYAQATQAIVHDHGLNTVKAATGTDDMRSRARAVMAQALLDVRAYLGTMFRTQDAEKTKGVMDLWKGFCFIKHLASYVSQLALTSFTQAEELNNSVGDAGWGALESVQSVGAQTWRAIEQARASFYLAHYETISELIQTHKLKVPLMFDANGLIPEKKRTKKLPMHLVLNTTEKN